MWPDLELGRDDAGFEETVAQIQREQMLAYLDEILPPKQSGHQHSGEYDGNQTIELVQTLFGDWSPSLNMCIAPVCHLKIPNRLRLS